MKRICLINGNMSRRGGTERMTQVLADELAQLPEFEVFVVSVTFCNNTGYQLSDVVHFFSLPKVHGKIGMLKTASNILSFIIRHNIDIVINVDVFLGIYTLPIKFIRRKLKIISWEQFNLQNDLGITWSNKLRKFCLKYSDHYVCLTKTDLIAFQQKYGTQHSRIDYVYNPYNESLLNIIYDPNSKIIITAGNFYHTKGFDLAVEVANKCLPNHPDWIWKFYGDGIEYDSIEEKIKQYGLKDRVILPGHSDKMYEVYSEAGIYVMTSRLEGFGLVLLDAKASGVPMVAFNCPSGPAEIIDDGQNGNLIEPFNIDAMSSALNNLMDDKEKRKAYSDSARKNLNNYSKETFVNKWISIINSVF